ncbi:MAG: hypothetical protein AMXMBFR82_09100 [Candidatus Hydrogenedentota bacterium]
MIQMQFSLRQIAVPVLAGLVAAHAFAQGIQDPSIEADRLILQAEEYANEGRWKEAADTLAKVESLEEKLSGSLPVEFYFRVGSTYARAYSPSEGSSALDMARKARSYLTKYLNLAGRDGASYKEALSALGRIEKAENDHFDAKYNPDQRSEVMVSLGNAARAGDLVALAHFIDRYSPTADDLQYLFNITCDTDGTESVLSNARRSVYWLYGQNLAKPSDFTLYQAVNSWNPDLIKWHLSPEIVAIANYDIKNPESWAYKAAYDIVTRAEVRVRDRAGLSYDLILEVETSDWEKTTPGDWYEILKLYSQAGGVLDQKIDGTSIWWVGHNPSSTTNAISAKRSRDSYQSRVDWVSQYFKTGTQRWSAHYSYGSKTWRYLDQK